MKKLSTSDRPAGNDRTQPPGKPAVVEVPGPESPPTVAPRWVPKFRRKALTEHPENRFDHAPRRLQDRFGATARGEGDASVVGRHQKPTAAPCIDVAALSRMPPLQLDYIPPEAVGSCFRSRSGRTAGVYFWGAANLAGQLVAKFPQHPINELATTLFVSNFVSTPRTRLLSKDSPEARALFARFTELLPGVRHDRLEDAQDTEAMLRAWASTEPNCFLVMERFTGVELRALQDGKAPAQWLNDRALFDLGCGFVADGACMNGDRFGAWQQRNPGNIMVNKNGEICFIDQEVNAGLSHHFDREDTGHRVEFMRMLEGLRSRVPEQIAGALYGVIASLPRGMQVERRPEVIRAVLLGALEGVRRFAGIDLDAVTAAAKEAGITWPPAAAGLGQMKELQGLADYVSAELPDTAWVDEHLVEIATCVCTD